MVPAAARAHTLDGAKAFAAYFVKALNDAQVTTDASTLLAISESECKGCRTFVDGAADMRAKGHHVDRPSLKLDDLLVRPNSTDNRVNVDLLITESASNTVDARGKVIESFTSDRFTLRTTLTWLGTRWIVTQALLVAS
jgi:hypothetical protein